MRHPLHVALSVPVGVPAPAPTPATAARHRKPRRPSPVRSALAALALVPPAGRLAAGLGAASVLAATVLTAVVDPAAPVAPDRVPARQSSTFAQVSGN
ncbi:hypothetical protein ACFV0H_21595 [Streptomyces erythrochromogenes]|uniref:Uncharacterized protein n=1 Tax=Streptomyces erythrochromogenes TaxID=285574 RepID=A0ABZ1QFU9_9ACTN|nr:hypothetical protein [Streptomyces erythrochromogenes]MCX5586910.1 hypothetical protein [Streptomyces erythrochromogenes]